MKKYLTAMLWLLLYAASAYAYKEEDRVPDPMELRLLPRYCKDTQVISRIYGRQQGPSAHDVGTQVWVDTYGSDFWHLHHYCFGLTYVIRSNRAFDQKLKKKLLAKTIDEYDYVLQRAIPNFVLRPEILVKKAQSLLLLKRESEAVITLRMAIDIKPDYSLPYAYLSDYYESLSKPDLALATLEEGLGNKPNSTLLLHRYKKLGGKKIFPPPAEPVTQDTLPAKETSPPVTDIKSEEVSAPAVIEPSPAPDQKPNPYCRFCP